MARNRRRSVKIIEKFRKSAEKDKERARSLIEKCAGASDGEGADILAELADRLKQKELLASGDIVWAEQQIELARESKKRAEKSDKKDKSKAAAAEA